jgi:predicted transport protein
MYEVSLDPGESEGMTVEQIARQMWRFSAEEMAAGTLDALGEQTFTDGKVRKALAMLMTDPPRTLLNLVRKTVGDEGLTPQKIKESLTRIGVESSPGSMSTTAAQTPAGRTLFPGETEKPRRRKKTERAQRAKKGESLYDEDRHLRGKPQEAIQLYRTIDRTCMGLLPGGISRRYLAKTVNYELNGRCFCSVHLLQGGLRVWLRLKLSRIENPPLFARDVSNVGHWGTGDVELRLSNRGELEQSAELIRQSFEGVR